MLADSLKLFDHVVLIDAVMPVTSAKPYEWINFHQLKTNSSVLSSHAIGLAESLEWIKAADEIPKDIALLGLSTSNQTDLVELVANCLNVNPD